jgi:hypothetical protein
MQACSYFFLASGAGSTVYNFIEILVFLVQYLNLRCELPELLFFLVSGLLGRDTIPEHLLLLLSKGIRVKLSFPLKNFIVCLLVILFVFELPSPTLLLEKTGVVGSLLHGKPWVYRRMSHVILSLGRLVGALLDFLNFNRLRLNLYFWL